MRVRRAAVIGLILVLALAFLFLVPVIAYPLPPGRHDCLPNGCPFAEHESLTYWAFGIGATVGGVRGYSIQVSPGGASCIRTGEGWAFHVRVTTDRTNAAVSGAKVNAISYTTCASGNTTWGSPITTTTPDNGTVTLPTGGVDGYSIVVAYQGIQYPVGVIYIAPVQITTVTLSVPSGNVTIVHSAPGPS